MGPVSSGKGSSARRSRTRPNACHPRGNVSPPKTACRRISKVRKALNFDDETVPKRKKVSGYCDESAAFRFGFEEAGTHSSLVPPVSQFWAYTPSLAPFHPTPPDCFSLTDPGIPPQRRSERLILKGFPTSEHDGPDKPHTAIPIHDPEDSGLGPSPPCSQNPDAPFNSFKCPSDAVSVHSDYGTSSETSISFYKRKVRVTRSSVKRKKSFSLDLSPGYVSDFEEDLKNHDQHEQTATSWDSEDEDRTDICGDLLLSLPEEWDRAIQEEESICSLSSFVSSYPNIPVKWLSYEGIHVLIPLEGYSIPSVAKARALSTPPTFMLRDYLEEPSPSPSVYDTRKKSRFKPKPAPPSPFSIRTCPNSSLCESFRRRGLRVLAASPVISVEPLGTCFSAMYPAIVSIPLDEVPALGDEIYCLYSSDPKVESESGNKTDPCLLWSVLHDVKIALEGGRLTFETYELCSFVIVVREKCIDASKQIRARIGGRLLIPEAPWVEINFPKGSVTQDITAKAKLFLDTEMSLPDFMSEGRLLGSENTPFTLAAPIVMMEPHGIDFGPDQVTIQLPVPDYDQVLDLYGPRARISIWQSCTTENEPTVWKPLDVDYLMTKLKCLGRQTTVISFKVSHFSFFRVIWDILSASLYEARIGMSYLHNFIAFSMKCQANMEEADNSRFGLEITCYRSDKCFPEATNYRYKVGGSSKPKQVRPGKITVKLNSHYFEADQDAGEDASLIKEESDFRGRDFEVQYCCKFKTDKAIDRGPFGKVIVKRFLKAGQEELLFEFNLQKSGHEGEKTPWEQNDRWSIIALQELAASLFITDGDNWKIFANHIGFTKKEIKMNFKGSADPFIAMVNMYQHRGGTPDEFVQALYAVNREIKVSGGVSPALSQKSRSSTGSSGRGSMKEKDSGSRNGYQHLSDSDTSGTQISQDSVLAGTRKRSNPSVNRSSGNGSSSKRKPKRRKVLPPDSAGESGKETSSEHEKHSSFESSSDSDGERGRGSLKTTSEHASSIEQRNDLTKLDPAYLWGISAHMDGLNWKSLGRTLGIDEAILTNVEHTHRQTGLRECAYQMLLCWKEKFPKRCNFGGLYTALNTASMNSVAKKMRSIKVSP